MVWRDRPGEKSSHHTGPNAGNQVKLRLIKDHLPLPPPTFAFRKWPHHPCSPSTEPEAWELYSAHLPSPPPHPIHIRVVPSSPIGPKFVQLLDSSNNEPVGSILPPSDLPVTSPPERSFYGANHVLPFSGLTPMWHLKNYLPHLSTPFSPPRNALTSSRHLETVTIEGGKDQAGSLNSCAAAPPPR